jgi:hypothetical protein
MYVTGVKKRILPVQKTGMHMYLGLKICQLAWSLGLHMYLAYINSGINQDSRELIDDIAYNDFMKSLNAKIDGSKVEVVDSQFARLLIFRVADVGKQVNLLSE